MTHRRKFKMFGKSGKLFVWTLKDLCEVIEGCVYNQFDFICFIEGNRGEGKSTLAYKIASKINIPIPFRPKRDIVFTREEVIKHLANKKGGVIIADELINVAYLRDFYQEEQKTLLKGLNMYRDKNNVFLGCVPKFVEIDKQLQRLCKMRITVVRRGIALIQTQLPSIYMTDGWDIKNNMKIESTWSLRGTKKPQYARLTTVRGILRFGDLTPQQREGYEAIKEEKRGQVFEKYGDKTLLGNPEKIFYENIITQMKAGKLTPDTLDTICQVNNKEVKKVREKINVMLKELGEEKRVKDYVLDEKRQMKKDKLGFLMQETKKKFATPTDFVPAISRNETEEQETEEETQENVFDFEK